MERRRREEGRETQRERVKERVQRFPMRKAIVGVSTVGKVS